MTDNDLFSKLREDCSFTPTPSQKQEWLSGGKLKARSLHRRKRTLQSGLGLAFCGIVATLLSFQSSPEPRAADPFYEELAEFMLTSPMDTYYEDDTLATSFIQFE